MLNGFLKNDLKNPIISTKQCKVSTFKSTAINKIKWFEKHTMKGMII